ncbi:APC family permease [candidate division KSB1 bacterium]
MPDLENGSGKLERKLGLFDSTMMMVGIVIGSGIFLITGIMAKSLPSAGMILLAWGVGGLITLAGALTYAELGAAMPHAGGQYVYLREAYGHLAAFLFGWILFLVSMGGAIAAAAVGFAEYFGYFFPALSTTNYLFEMSETVLGVPVSYSLSTGQLVAFFMILILSAVNYLGAGLGKTIQNILSATKIGTILVFIILGLTFGGNVADNIQTGNSALDIEKGSLIIGFGLALVAVSWAFDGWHNINYVAGEIKNPKRNLPLTLFLGVSIITVLYMLVNIVYIKAVPVSEMSGVVRIAEKASTNMFGGNAASLISAAVLISTFGSLNGAIFVAPRVYYAMAQDKVFFRRAEHIHPKYKTPSFAIGIQAFWAGFLTLTGSYEQLFIYVTVINIVFWIAGTTSVFRLRKIMPDLQRPYKTWGYPYIPIVFIISLLWILINTLIQRPIESFAGLGLTLLGIPVYYYWRNKAQRDR